MTARHGGYVESYEIAKYDDNLFLVILLTPVLNVPNAKIKSQFFDNSLSSLLTLSLSLKTFFSLSPCSQVQWQWFMGFPWCVWGWVQWFWVDFCRAGLILVCFDFVVDFLGCAKLILWLLGWFRGFGCWTLSIVAERRSGREGKREKNE